MKKTIFIVLLTLLTTQVLFGCSNKSNKAENEVKSNVKVDDILKAIRAAYGDSYLPNFEITPEFLESEFGLTSDLYEEAKGEQPMVSVHADRVVVVKAAKGKADAVEKALIEAKDKKINDSLQYPMNLPKINATKVVRKGDYVCFLLVGALNEDFEMTEKDAKEFAEKEVKKAVKAFEELFK